MPHHTVDYVETYLLRRVTQRRTVTSATTRSSVTGTRRQHCHRLHGNETTPQRTRTRMTTQTSWQVGGVRVVDEAAARATTTGPSPTTTTPTTSPGTHTSTRDVGVEPSFTSSRAATDDSEEPRENYSSPRCLLAPALLR